MFGKCLRCLRDTVCLEVLLAGDDIAVESSDGPADDVCAWGWLSQAYGEIDAVCEEVQYFVVKDDVQFELWIRQQEGADVRHDALPSECSWNRNTEWA